MKLLSKTKSSWTAYNNPSTLADQQAKVLAQFDFDYGHELLCASLRDQPILTAPRLESILSIEGTLNGNRPS